ncbi:MAG: hypothetical protein WCF25_04745, partial [Acidimicrobiales bacterium]
MRINTRRGRILAASVAMFVAGGVGVAAAASTTPTPSNATSKGMGISEYGMTQSFFNGGTVSFTYSKGFYCDRTVSSGASSGCEAGANYKVAPAKNFDPLYIAVPLGFTVPMMSMECPTALVCVDHPGTIDLSRLEPDLKALYPQYTAAQLTAALKDSATPGHEHFITTTNGGKAEWWDVKVIGVTSMKEWNAIVAHKSFAFLNQQVTKKLTTPIIPTNLFLYFS